MAKHRKANGSVPQTPCRLEMSYVIPADEDTNRTIKALLLKIGYAVTTIKGEVLIVNTKFRGDYASCMSALCNQLGLEYCTFLIEVNNQRGWMVLKDYFHLMAYEEYSRGARMAITAIFEKNRHLFTYNSEINGNFATEK